MTPPLSLENTQGVFWRLIEDRQALSMTTVASALGRTPSQLRRALRHDLGTTFRKVRAQSRVAYAVRAIERGEKVEAVIREVGLHNRTSFIKQCRFYTGKSPHNFLPARVNGRNGSA
jgi:methylphosphotriester-DNA--protein-cysteine methyltransferase